MLTIKKKYIINKEKKRVAVQLPIKTFEKMEEMLEDYVLMKKMKENDRGDGLELNEAKEYYGRLKKNPLCRSFTKRNPSKTWPKSH